MLNGGEVKGFDIPTNEELWEMWKADYVAFYSNLYGDKFVASDDRPINDVLGFTWINSLGDGVAMEFMTQDNNWAWLKDYMLSIAEKDGYELDSDKEWRYHLYAFFNCDNASYRIDGYCPGPTADFTEAGQPEEWGPYSPYIKEVDVQLPNQVTETYILPTPTHPNGYTFLGWYNSANFVGDAIVAIPARWVGTLYAKWNGMESDVEYITIDDIVRIYDIMGRMVGTDKDAIGHGVFIIEENGQRIKIIR